jgi:hypothetical protein
MEVIVQLHTLAAFDRNLNVSTKILDAVAKAEICDHVGK